RFLTIELDRNLGRQLGATAVYARRSRRMLEELHHAGGVVRRILTGHIGDEKVDRLFITAAGTGRGHDGRRNVRQILFDELLISRDPVIRRMLAIVFEEDVDLADVTLRNETAEGRRIRSGDRRFVLDIALIDVDRLSLELERLIAHGVHGRSNGICELNVDLAAIGGWNELLADDA